MINRKHVAVLASVALAFAPLAAAHGTRSMTSTSEAAAHGTHAMTSTSESQLQSASSEAPAWHVGDATEYDSSRFRAAPNSRSQSSRDTASDSARNNDRDAVTPRSMPDNSREAMTPDSTPDNTGQALAPGSRTTSQVPPSGQAPASVGFAGHGRGQFMNQAR